MKYSIITINKDNSLGLQKTMISVLNQSFADFEFIVIDGASADNSLDVITKLEPQFNHRLADSSIQNFIWLSESDSGIYNAMNKGISLSKGDYLLFLNSGDFLNDNYVLEDISNELSIPNVDVLSGGLWIVDSGIKVNLLSPAKEVSLYHCIHKGILHPCTFIKRSLFFQYGFYNERNKYISDFEFFIIACGLNKCEYRFTNREISCFNTLGITSQKQNIEELEAEALNSINRVVPKPIRIDIERLRKLEMKFELKEIADMERLKDKPFFYKILTKIISWIS